MPSRARVRCERTRHHGRQRRPEASQQLMLRVEFEADGAVKFHVTRYIGAQHVMSPGHACAIAPSMPVSTLAYSMVVSGDRCRRTAPMASRVAPARSMPVAAECRSRRAPREGALAFWPASVPAQRRWISAERVEREQVIVERFDRARRSDEPWLRNKAERRRHLAVAAGTPVGPCRKPGLCRLSSRRC